MKFQYTKKIYQHDNICTYDCSELKRYTNETGDYCYLPIPKPNISNSEEIIEICDIFNFFMIKCNKSFINEEEKYYFKIDIINSIQNGSLSELIDYII